MSVSVFLPPVADESVQLARQDGGLQPGQQSSRHLPFELLVVCYFSCCSKLLKWLSLPEARWSQLLFPGRTRLLFTAFQILFMCLWREDVIHGIIIRTVETISCKTKTVSTDAPSVHRTWSRSSSLH